MFRKKQKEPKIERYELWSLWEADLRKVQKAFADYAALDRPAECPEEKRKEIREGLIQEAKHPQRHLVIKNIFNIVFDYVPFSCVLNLLLSFFPAANFECRSSNFEN